MPPVTTSVEDIVAGQPNRDNQETFKALWDITCALFEKVSARFDLQPDPCTDDLQNYAGKDGAAGQLSAYSGPQVDWLIHSWTGNPASGFCNMHLSVYLGPHIDVPHFGFALGTMPDIFWYLDTMPRRELATNPDYVDRYWQGDANSAALDQLNVPGFTPFVSRDVYTRAVLSPNMFCYSVPIAAENIASIEAASHACLDRWLQWVDAAQPVSKAERAILYHRDETVRRTICERDPANTIAKRLFGEELTHRLVSTLWGGTRTLPRPK